MIDITFDRILSIGINYVGTSAELRGCINDVINLKNSTKAGSRVIMTELATDKTLIPTRANIILQMRKFVADVKPGMNLLFQYSGHGSHRGDRNADDTDGQDETICPLDYAKTGDITDDQLRMLLADTLPAGCTLWCFFDSCHSGTVMDLPSRYLIDSDRDNAKRLVISRKNSKKNPPTKAQVICFSGCQDHDFSSDSVFNGQPQGAMTASFLHVIKTLKEQNKPLSYKNIMKSMLKLLKDGKYNQIPQLSTGKPMNLDTLFATSGLPGSRNLDRADSSDNGDTAEEEDKEDTAEEDKESSDTEVKEEVAVENDKSISK
jgi:hypothetical protein